MNYRIGISGAHRTGKTTLAKELAEAFEIPYIDVGVRNSDVWKVYSPDQNVSFIEREYIQTMLLSELGQKFMNLDEDESFVMDRTPIDYAAYLLAGVDSTTNVLLDSRIEHFIDCCVDMTTDEYTHIIVVQPGIEYEIQPGKAGNMFQTRTYQETLTSLIIGSYARWFIDTENVDILVLPEAPTDLKYRVIESLKWLTDGESH